MDLNQLTQNPEQIKQLISLLEALLPNKNESDETPGPSGSEAVEDTSVTYATKNKPKEKVHQNKFLSMPEINMHKEDRELDQKLAKHAPVARARDYEPVTVICRLCGKKERISPALVESSSRYKCNKCSSSAG